MLFADRGFNHIFVDVDESKSAAFDNANLGSVIGSEMVEEIALRRRIGEISHI
jgi:hypothetical protein